MIPDVIKKSGNISGQNRIKNSIAHLPRNVFAIVNNFYLLTVSAKKIFTDV